MTFDIRHLIRVVVLAGSVCLVVLYASWWINCQCLSHALITESCFIFIPLPECAEKNTIPALRVIEKLKKVKTVADCSQKCNQEPDCGFYKWKVIYSVVFFGFTSQNLYICSEPQEGRQEAVSLDADPIHCKEDLVVWN